MTVNMRKEQVLLLVVILLGAWLAYGDWTDKYRRRGASPKPKEYQHEIPLPPFLAHPKGDPGLGGDIFLEPSETRPLPPTDLPFPALDPLLPVALPLPIGQQAGAYQDLRLKLAIAKVAKGGGVPGAGAPAAGVPGAAAPGGAPGGAGGAGAPVQDPLSPEQLAKRYDRLIMMDGFNKYWGYFVGPDELKYKLGDSAGPYPEKITVTFQWINERSGKLVKLLTKEATGNKVKQLQLAKTVKNEVAVRDRRLLWTGADLSKQVELIRWLIEQGRREPWVYVKAMQRANTHIGCAHQDVSAYRLKVRVLRAQGDLEGEWKLYQELPKKLMESAFRYQGMGEIQAMLGLREAAEQNLRKAVALAPVSPHARGALARFLLAQGRPKEAVGQVDNAARDRGRLEFADERLLLDQTVVGAHLAVGDVAGAKAALPIDLPVELTDQVRYLEGCVAYAEGDLDKALSEFEACAAGGKVPDAALGIAACKLRQGKVVAARDAFDAVADQNPRLRHLALAGKGLALEHIDGEQAAAVEALEAALEANPQHPYVLYLLGRERRRNGDLDGAVEALKQALMRRDDLSEAHGELAVTYERLYQRDTDASALSHAVRYIDRLVASEAAALNGDRKPTILFREMQGRYHFEAGDYRGARAAFEAGRDQSDFCKIGQAIVAYKQKRYDEARDTLGELRRDLPLKHPDREFAKKLVNRMDAHDNLEQIQVTFDGQRLPKSWHTKQAGRAEGGLKPRVHAGELHIGDDRQRFRGSRPVVMAWRELPGTGRFVSLDLSFRNAGDHVPFVGLEINNRRESGGVGRQDFMARFGLNENGFLFLQILDGRNPKDVDREPLTFKHVVVHRDQLNHLRLEAVPQKGDEDNKTLFLRAWWNGEMVHERRLQRLRRATGKSSGKLNLELKVEGKNGKQVKVVFDNFRLVQIRGS